MPAERASATSPKGRTWETISLEPVVSFAHEEFDGVAFFMTGNSSLLRVLVTHEALREAGGKFFSDEEYLEQFEAFRSEFELVACDKFASGRTERDGSIRIDAADLMDILFCWVPVGGRPTTSLT